MIRAVALCALLGAGCVSTDLTTADGTTLHRLAFATSIGAIHASSSKAADGSLGITIDEQAVDQTTALANALQTMAGALSAAVKPAP